MIYTQRPYTKIGLSFIIVSIAGILITPIIATKKNKAPSLKQNTNTVVK